MLLKQYLKETLGKQRFKITKFSPKETRKNTRNLKPNIWKDKKEWKPRNIKQTMERINKTKSKFPKKIHKVDQTTATLKLKRKLKLLLSGIKWEVFFKIIFYGY